MTLERKKFKVGDKVWAVSHTHPEKVVEAVVVALEPSTQSYYIRFEDGYERQDLGTTLSCDIEEALDLVIEFKESTWGVFEENGLDDIAQGIGRDIVSLRRQRDALKSKTNKEKPMNIQERTEDIVRWIKNWFETNGKGCNAVVGISGGKDSLIVAALCAKALGSDRVIGVLMPNGYQKDIKDAEEACRYLKIEAHRVNIGQVICDLLEEVGRSVSFFPSEQTATNLPARIRMATLYAISQTCNGRVANTCNRSENYVGYETKYGDGAGDFSPLGNLTVKEVLEIGDYLGLPHHLVHKAPIDGLKTNEDGSYVTDEQSLGFTYEELDSYLLNVIMPSEEKLERIRQLHARGVAKRQMGVYTKPELEEEWQWK